MLNAPDIREVSDGLLDCKLFFHLFFDQVNLHLWTVS